MHELDLTRIQKIAELGAFVAQLGLYRISAAKLMATQQDVELLWVETVQLAKTDLEPELQVELKKVQESLMKHRLAALELGFKAAKEMPREPNDNGGGRSPIPFPPNVAVQVNVNGSEVGTSVK